MAKESWNIKDFSGGVNKVIDKRDIEANESASLNNLVSYHPGSLALGGFYYEHSQSSSFQLSDNKDNTPALYMQPSAHFTKHLFLASVAIYADETATITTGDANFPLTRGSVITFLSTGDNSAVYIQLIGNSYTIVTDNEEGTYTFNLGGDTIGSSGNTTAYVVVGSEGDNFFNHTSGIFNNRFNSYTKAEDNRIILVNDGYGKFGYWNLKTGGFVGSAVDEYYEGGLLKTLFNTRYLWDWHNVNQHPDSNNNINQAPESIQTHDMFFSDGVVRVIEDMPKTWHYGWCRNPVGFYYIENHKKFGDVNKIGSLEYTEGWYPLRSHCLSPGQYRTDTLYNSSGFIQNGGTLQTSAQTTIAGMVSNEHLTAPNNPYQINICISGKTANGNGDWQCGSAAEHENIGLGISLIYDNINQESLGSFSQESSITNLSDESITITGGENNCSLLIGYMINPGSFWQTNTFNSNKYKYSNNDDSENLQGDITYAEAYTSFYAGSNHNNLNSWNPRVVGANIYCTKYKTTLESPTLLGTINFYGEIEKHGSSHSHDGSQAGNWVQHSDGNFYGSFTVESIPIMDYFSKNLYQHTEQHQIWYKTSAIVNRKLYVGNVGYFSDTNPLLMNENDKLELHPDKILMSPGPNKFDTFPVEMGLEIAKFDGQDIICLKNFNNELLVFKTNDLFTIDCSGEDEILKDTIRGKGIKSKNHFVQGDNAVYFFNSSGLYQYDGQQVIDLTQDKIDYKTWKNKIYNDLNNISYDYEYNLLLVTTTYNEKIANTNSNNKNTLIYNVKNQSFFFKSGNGIYNHLSNGFNAESELYKIGYTTNYSEGASNASLIPIESTTFIPGVKSFFQIAFSLSANGTWAGVAGGDCQIGTLNTHAKHMKILQGQDGSTDKWITLNTAPFVPTKNLNDATTANIHANYNNTVEIMRNAFNLGTHADYQIDYVYKLGNTSSANALIMIGVRAKNPGTYYNLGTALNLDALGPPFNIVANRTGNNTWKFGMADDNVENTNANTALQADGSSASSAPNLSEATTDNSSYNFNFTTAINNNAGTDATPSVHVITPDCGSGGSISSGTTFSFDVKLKSETSSSIPMSGIYVIGNNPFDDNYVYTDESTLSGQSTVNEMIVDQMLKALVEDKISSGSYKLNDYFLIQEASSTTISFTLRDNHPHIGEFNINEIEFNTNVISLTPYNKGKLLTWVNKLPVDANNNSLINDTDLVYESKDIDFDQPNVRKKVYKIYITYTGGNGNVQCEYQVNQSGTWATPIVLDSSGSAVTKAGYLNTSSTQTRGELKLGTGGNNIYSIALKLSGEGSSSFEINDISIVYRLKSVK